MKKRPRNRGTEKVILPINGRPNGPPAESVFSDEKREDIAMLGEVFRKLTHLGAISIPLVYFFFDDCIFIRWKRVKKRLIGEMLYQK